MSQNVSNSYSKVPSSYPTMSASAFGPQYTPGPVQMTYQPYATPHAVPMGTQITQTQAPVNPISPSNRCNLVTVQGIGHNRGCILSNENGDHAVIPIGGPPYSFTNGPHSIQVVGNDESRLCQITYKNTFDSGAFALQDNASFLTCI